VVVKNENQIWEEESPRNSKSIDKRASGREKLLVVIVRLVSAPVVAMVKAWGSTVLYLDPGQFIIAVCYALHSRAIAKCGAFF
jgi:hypothetical protein